MTWKLSELPLKQNLETVPVLKELAVAHRYLAELKGVARTIPNETILISTLTLREAKDSSEIESIITTQDELFKAELHSDLAVSIATKEVQNYAEALRKGFDVIRKDQILTLNNILDIQKELEQNDAGLRKQIGTSLKNSTTGEIVYTPPQEFQQIKNLMSNLVQFINDEQMSPIDPLIKVAIIHHQFESIHPFYDGNGRTGRIINILYLVCKDLLTLPVLYLSKYIVTNKDEYYRLLQSVRDDNEWEGWIIFLLKGVSETSKETIYLIQEIKELMQYYKIRLRNDLPKIYSQELLNNLFRHPYTKIDFVTRDLQIERRTAAKYLDSIVDLGLLKKEKYGRSNYYFNDSLIKCFIESK